MGGKRNGARQCIYLCLAGLMLLAASACALSRAAPCVPDKESRLPALRELIDRGAFDEAARQSEGILSASPQSPQVDEALYALGLVFAHAGNPKKDYRKSRDSFARLVKEHPGSPLAGEAKIWIGVLDTIEKTKQIDIEIEGKKKEIVK